MKNLLVSLEKNKVFECFTRFTYISLQKYEWLSIFINEKCNVILEWFYPFFLNKKYAWSKVDLLFRITCCIKKVFFTLSHLECVSCNDIYLFFFW